ncbi:DNA-processing protein DprA [Brachybacterium alimentarium]|uniref:DNA-processing protein DprA n=1 Tax=Brachybacterium alimentarium TaxID=47845 RepID=UPI000DF4B9AE|nr:DNA-processing protein DprA [Brachybacterium alimentarium]RCS79603.1 DNA processing protein DprA [Brachybacterium alimentarium]
MARLAEQVAGERQARMMLSMIAEPDDPATGHILHRAGGVETLRLLEDDQAAVPEMNRTDAIAWRNRVTPRIGDYLTARLAEAERAGMSTLIPTDAHWPHALNDLGPRAPYLLWTRGATSFLSGALGDRVTITGSRAATDYGVQVAAQLAGDLAREERTIVAGGAYGIDAAAHRAALATGGSTIAILAGGVDRPYPRGNAGLLDRIGDVGLLASEMPPGVAPTRYRFMARARLLGTLSGATVIPEASFRSGSLLVPTEAHRHSRAVGALPGPVTSAASSGPHELIKRGRAEIITGTTDVTALLDSLHDPGRLLDRQTPSRQFDTPTAGTPPAGPRL